MSDSVEVLGLRAIDCAGIQGADLLAKSSGAAFEDGSAVFRIGLVLLKIIRDRGQVFLDLGSAVSPDHFYHFDDVEVAMGWRSIESVLAKVEPEPLDQVLIRLSEHLEELQQRMSHSEERRTRGIIERAARLRGDAFAQSLR